MAEYGTPTAPAGRPTVVITSEEAAMWIDKLLLTTCEAVSEAETLNEKSPTTVGVPLIVPFAAIESPVGSVPEARERVTAPKPPDVSTCVLYAVPETPLGSEEVVMANGGGLMVIEN